MKRAAGENFCWPAEVVVEVHTGAEGWEAVLEATGAAAAELEVRLK